MMRPCTSCRQTSCRLSMNQSGAGRQRGLSLVELMIGMVLGMIVISGVYSMFTSSSRSSRFTDGLQMMQENGRYGVSVLQKGLRLAGYSPGTRIEPLDIAAGDATTLVVQMRQAYDCNGQDTAPMGGLAINTYQLDNAAGQITCTGNSAAAAAMPVVEGVDGLRVLYGIDSDDDDVPEQYIAYDAGINPFQVSSVRFAVLVNSGQPIRSHDHDETYVLLDQEIAINDRMARNVFSSTIKLRNRR